MTGNTKKIRQIIDRGLGPSLTNAGFHRHGPTFSRKYGEALHAIDLQLNKYNSRVGELMPEHGEHWWSVTSGTDGDVTSKGLATTCSSYVLPWLEQFKTLANVDWKSMRGGMIQHSHAPAAARLVLGDREGAAKYIATELLRIECYPADRKWKEEASGQTISWAAKHGIPISSS